MCKYSPKRAAKKITKSLRSKVMCLCLVDKRILEKKEIRYQHPSTFYCITAPTAIFEASTKMLIGISWWRLLRKSSRYQHLLNLMLTKAVKSPSVHLNC